jgi:2-polyprenyl-3-methyl-5-hydroxy-6-metoxy-1,4-benzoquinol methylase
MFGGNGMPVKRVVKSMTPPIVWESARRLTKPLRPHVVTEHPADWFDGGYEGNEQYYRHYTRSQYYPSWTVFADRIFREGVQSLLDVGCGPGQFGAFMRDRGLASYCGFDFSEVAIRQACKVCPEFEFVIADVYTTDLFDKYAYDTVICMEVLEHIERDLDVLKRIRPGTRFFGSVPNFDTPSHVRFFDSPEEVVNRYGTFFTDFRVDPHLASEAGSVLFLVEGTKRQA